MTPAITALDAAAVPYQIHEYDHDPAERDVGAEAATKLGLDSGQVFKTLVVTADGSPAVAIVPVSSQVSMKAVGRALGAKRVEMSDLGDAERITGYVRGGISPFGQRRRLVTVIDASASLYDVIYVSGGRRGLDLAVAPNDLVGLLDAHVADIAASP